MKLCHARFLKGQVISGLETKFDKADFYLNNWNKSYMKYVSSLRQLFVYN